MFKINLSTKHGKTFHLEAEAESLMEKSLGDKISGNDINHDLSGYEFEIAGASDKAGFTSMEDVAGIGLKKVLLNYGKGLHKKPKGDKKKNKKPKGMRMRKTVRGKVISPEISQINLKVIKEGHKPLSEIFPEQNKTKQGTESPTSSAENVERK